MQWIAKLRGFAIAGALIVTGIVTAAAPVHADIRAFNDAMQAKDYKKAAAEAADSWQTLDKNRADIAAIAREFGMAAFMAQDYTAARNYAVTAVSAGEKANEGRAERIGSEVLLRLSEHKLAPSMDTRSRLLTALQASATLTGIDLISYLGVSELVSFDISKQYWKSTRVSAALAEKLTQQGGPGYAAISLEFGLLKAMAEFGDDRDIDGFDSLAKARARIVDAINRAPTADSASKLVPLYWEATAWKTSAESMLDGSDKLKAYKARSGPEPDVNINTPAGKLIRKPQTANVCATQLNPKSPRPVFPSIASMKGMMGTVILDVDLDADGKVIAADILAAAPDKYFGDYTLKAVNRFTFDPRKGSQPGCTLAQTGMVFTFVFHLRD
jgi:TonB family protein